MFNEKKNNNNKKKQKKNRRMYTKKDHVNFQSFQRRSFSKNFLMISTVKQMERPKDESD